MAENLVYRGHPLRRVDNLVYYGSMADKYIIMMQVLDTEDVKDLKLAKRVSIQLQLTDPNLRSRGAWRRVGEVRPRGGAPRRAVSLAHKEIPFPEGSRRVHGGTLLRPRA